MNTIVLRPTARESLRLGSRVENNRGVQASGAVVAQALCCPFVANVLSCSTKVKLIDDRGWKTRKSPMKLDA